MRKIILSILGLLVIAGAVFLAMELVSSKKSPKPVENKVVKTVFTEEVENTDIQIVIPSNGSLVAKRRVELYAEVQGIFKSRNKLYKPGQTYNTGETLIRIDASEYYASVQSAKSNLYNAIVSIMPDLRLDFPDIYGKWQKYIDGFDLNKATPKLPDMPSQKENYFITGRNILTSYYNVKNLEKRLDKYTISAPFSGILTETLVTEGTLIRSGQKLGELIDPSIYEMEVALSGKFANLLRIGAEVSLNNLDKTATYKGKVARINGNIDPSTQTITAYIDVSDENLKEGMYLIANLNAKYEKNSIEIDRNLLLEGEQIYVVNDNVLDLLDVRPVYFSDKKVVLKDVPNGTIILKKAVPGAYAGMLVKPLEENKNL